MSELAQIASEILQTGLNLLQSLHISEVRQMFEFLGVQYTEVFVVLILFAFLHLSKFTAGLAMAFIITYGGFYMAANWSSNSKSASRRVPLHNPEKQRAAPNQSMLPTVEIPKLTSPLFPTVEGYKFSPQQNHSTTAMLPPYFDGPSIAYEADRFANLRNTNQFRMPKDSRIYKIKEQPMQQSSKARMPTYADIHPSVQQTIGLGARSRYTRHIKEPMSSQITADAQLRKPTTYADYKKSNAQNQKTGGIDYKFNISSQEASNSAGRAARRSIPAYYASETSKTYLQHNILGP